MTGHRRRLALGVYAVLIAASTVARTRLPDPPPPDTDQQVVALPPRLGEAPVAGRVALAYRDTGSDTPGPSAPVILLLHGSPGHGGDLAGLTAALRAHARVIVPDLPGFGRSTHAVPDYSFRAHAAYVADLLDRLEVSRVHVVGFSMGGGVAISLADTSLSRLASITMLSAIGVQEMELLGEYRINHAIHGLQLAGLWTARAAVPHFGWLDRAAIGVPYARNFYDSDQRPLRGLLAATTVPMLIVHGRRDVLVPYEAALEHHRIVPQSELHTTGASHFMVFTDSEETALVIADFVARVERGAAPSRAQADPARVAAARAPLDPTRLPRFHGVAAVTTSGLLALATLVSEDLASIAAGVLVAQDRLSFTVAAIACFVGILGGDLLLFAAGRIAGRRALALPGMSRLVAPDTLARSSAWIERRGPVVVFASRFVPGTRLATCLAAGILHTSAWRFTLWFAIACAVWTPFIVGGAALIGEPILASGAGHSLVLRAVLAIAAAAVLLRFAMALSTHRGRRLLVSRWRRLTRWEFWSPWVFYPPLLVWIAALMIRYRGATVFTAANPAMPAGGFVGESKFEILEGLAGAGPLVAAATLLRAEDPIDARVDHLRRFMQERSLTFPVVLKPDQGQRGSGVAIVGDAATVLAYLRQARGDVIAQEYVPGEEFGVFYCRHPSEPRGRVISVTEKRLVGITGDGRRTVERLILDDERAVCMARFFLRRHAARLDEVLPDGQPMPLVEVGTHCRGALFLDGADVRTPELDTAIDALARTFDGFDFGRFDIRVPDRAAFRRGVGFKVVELNGVTSEATHIYDPRLGLWHAYRVLAAQWRLAFEIGAANRARGVAPTGLIDLLRRLRAYRRVAAGHVDLSPGGAARSPALGDAADGGGYQRS